MKYSYSDSLITMAAAIAQACSLYINRNDNSVAPVTSKASTFLQLDINNGNNSNTVGIKFDNLSARKYFVLIHTTQQYAVMSKTIEK